MRKTGSIMALATAGLLSPALAHAQAQTVSACAARHQVNTAQEAKDGAVMTDILAEFKTRGFPALNGRLDEMLAIVARAPADLDAPCDGRIYVRARNPTIALLVAAAAKQAAGEGPKQQVTVIGFSPYAEAAFLAGSTYIERSDWAHADAMLRRGLELAPNDAPISNEEALSLTRLGNPVEAAAVIDKALSANPLLDKPMHARLLRTRGYILGEAGRFDEAIADYQESLTLEPNHGGALNEIAYLNKRKAGAKPQADVTYHGEQAKGVVPQN